MLQHLLSCSGSFSNLPDFANALLLPAQNRVPAREYSGSIFNWLFNSLVDTFTEFCLRCCCTYKRPPQRAGSVSGGGGYILNRLHERDLGKKHNPSVLKHLGQDMLQVPGANATIQSSPTMDCYASQYHTSCHNMFVKVMFCQHDHDSMQAIAFKWCVACLFAAFCPIAAVALAADSGYAMA